MRKIAIAGTAIALASCAAEQSPENAAVQNEVVATADAGEAGATANEALPSPPPKPGDNVSEPVTTGVIPAALRGRWGLTPNDCTSTRGDAKGLLTISDKQLRFYESRGILGRVEQAGPDRIEADFDFAGEGQTWQRRMTLEAEDGGRTLIRRESGPDAMPGPLRYSKCEAA